MEAVEVRIAPTEEVTAVFLASTMEELILLTAPVIGQIRTFNDAQKALENIRGALGSSVVIGQIRTFKDIQRSCENIRGYFSGEETKPVIPQIRTFRDAQRVLENIRGHYV